MFMKLCKECINNVRAELKLERTRAAVAEGRNDLSAPPSKQLDRWKHSLSTGYTSRIRITSSKTQIEINNLPPRRGRKWDRFTGPFSSLTWIVKARFRTNILEQQLNQFTQHQITKPLGGAYSGSAGGLRERDGENPLSRCLVRVKKRE